MANLSRLYDAATSVYAIKSNGDKGYSLEISITLHGGYDFLAERLASFDDALVLAHHIQQNFKTKRFLSQDFFFNNIMAYGECLTENPSRRSTTKVDILYFIFDRFANICFFVPSDTLLPVFGHNVRVIGDDDLNYNDIMLLM